MKPLQAPEIFQKPIASVDIAGLPSRGSPGFGEALIARIAMDYAGRGWNAVVTVDDEFVRVVAVPAHGMDPKTYVLGLLRERYLEDALPLLEALHGICLSELGRVEEALAPLERCIAIDAASPYAVDIVSMALESPRGMWVAEVPIKPKGISKRKRTIGTPEFRHFTEVEGRFANLLPAKGAAGPLH